MKELIYPFHTQAENRHCFPLLSCVYPEQLSASEPALLQVRVFLVRYNLQWYLQANSQLLTLKYLLVFWKKGKQAFTAVSVGHLSPFLSAAPWFLCSAGFIEVGFFAFLSHFLTSPLLTVFPDLFYLPDCVNKTQIFTQSYNGRFLF